MITAKTPAGEWLFACETLPNAVSFAKGIAQSCGHRKILLRDDSGRVVQTVYCTGGNKVFASAPSVFPKE
jgi:hypothetical protein